MIVIDSCDVTQGGTLALLSGALIDEESGGAAWESVEVGAIDGAIEVPGWITPEDDVDLEVALLTVVDCLGEAVRVPQAEINGTVSKPISTGRIFLLQPLM